MSEPLIDRIPFAKIVIGLAIGFSLGLCGVTFAVSAGGGNRGGFLEGLGMVELAVMAISAIGLIVTVIVWVALSVIGSFGEKVSQPQKLFGEEDDTKHDKKE